MTQERELKVRVRLDNFVSEYVALEKDKEEKIKSMFYDRDYSSGAVQTLYYLQDRIDYLIMRIISASDRLISNDLEIGNEIAVAVYNEHSSSMHRGISVLMHSLKE